MSTLGRAFVEVHAETDPFARELKRAMQRLAGDLREDTDRAGNLIGQRLGTQARRQFRQGFQRRRLELNVDANLSSTSVAATEGALRRVTRNREVDVRINRRGFTRTLGFIAQLIGQFVISMVQIFGDLFDVGRTIGRIFGESFQNITRNMTNASGAAASLSASIAQLAAGVAALIAVFAILVGLLATILALVIALTEAVQLILTVLPGFAAVAVVAIAPLVLIFTNLADAITATTEPMKAFRKEIEDLGPATGRALTSFRELVQFFISIREEVQESFFQPINRAIRNLETDLGPTFQEGFVQVANAAGRFAGAFIELFDHPASRRFFTQLFDLAALGFEQIGEAGVIRLIEAFATLIDETLPNIEDLIFDIRFAIEGWADAIEDFATDPQMQETLDEWEESFQAIQDVIENLIGLAGALFEGFRVDGLEIIQQINEDLEAFTDFLESDRGEVFFEGLRFSAEIFLSLIRSIAVVIAGIIVTLGIIRILFTEGLEPAVKAFREAFSPARDAANGLLAIFRNWNNILLAIKAPVRRFISGLRNALETARDILRQLGRWFDRLRNTLSPLRVIRAIVRNICAFASGVASFARTILNRFRSIRGPARSVRNIIRAARNFASGLSTFIRTAHTRLRNLASPARTIRGIFSTIRSFASGIASFIWSAVSAARTLSNINIPGGRFFGGILGGIFGQEGGIITRPTSLIAGEAGDEVLIPLTRPQRAAELLEASGLADMVRGGDGASANQPINITFSGSGSRFDDAVLDSLRRTVRVRGGNVQTVVGT